MSAGIGGAYVCVCVRVCVCVCAGVEGVRVGVWESCVCVCVYGRE